MLLACFFIYPPIVARVDICNHDLTGFCSKIIVDKYQFTLMAEYGLNSTLMSVEEYWLFICFSLEVYTSHIGRRVKPLDHFVSISDDGGFFVKTHPGGRISLAQV